jgi:xylose isomerase
LRLSFTIHAKKVGRKTMEEHLRFAISYWHTFCGTGGDPFGAGTKQFPWLQKPVTPFSGPMIRWMLHLNSLPK